MTTRTNTLTVVGYVTNFNQAKGFGFADTQDLPESRNNVPVFFHIDGAHKAYIEEDQLVLDNERDVDAHIPSRGRQPTVLLMEVTKGPKGWKAVRWGVRPGLRWVHDFIRGNTFNQVFGGMFTDEAQHVRNAHGTIANVILTPSTLTIALTSGDKYHYGVEGHVRYGQPRNGVFTVMFDGYDEVERTLTLAMPGFS